MALKDELDPYFLKESIATTKEWKREKLRKCTDVCLYYFL